MVHRRSSKLLQEKTKSELKSSQYSRSGRNSRVKSGAKKNLIAFLSVFIILLVLAAGLFFSGSFSYVASMPFFGSPKVKNLAKEDIKISKPAQDALAKVKKLQKTNASAISTKPWLKAQNENQLPVLMYHNIAPNPPDSNTMDPKVFEEGLKAMKSQGYVTVNSKDALKIIETKEKPSNKMVWLTFDDGLDSFYHNVFPLLKKYQMHATSFIITDNTKNSVAGTMTPAEIKEIADSGLVDFQSHTVSHADLSVLSDSDQKYQLKASKAYLDQLLKQNTQVICYPSGSHNGETGKIAASLGYKVGLLDPGRTYDGQVALNEAAEANQGMFSLERLRVSSDMGGPAIIATIEAATTYNESNVAK